MHPIAMAAGAAAVVTILFAVARISRGDWTGGVAFAVLALVFGAIVPNVQTVVDRILSQPPPSPSPTAVAEPVRAASLPIGPIELKYSNSTRSSAIFWVIGFAAGAVILFIYPDLLWRRWLAYPAAVVALLIAGVMLFIVWQESKERIVADATGVKVGSNSLDQRSVTWAEVETVRILELWTRSKSGNTLPRFISSHLVFEDKTGKELLKIEEPLVPEDRYRVFLDAVPGWTGRPVVREKRDPYESVR